MQVPMLRLASKEDVPKALEVVRQTLVETFTCLE